MNSIANFFRLIRWQNLAIITLTQGFVWLFVIVPLRQEQMAGFFLSPMHFALLCLSTVLIAAGGYVINDYFDVRIDLINKPHKVLIENVFSRRTAILMHSSLNLAGLILASSLAYKIGNMYLIFIQVFCTLLLWIYSTKFKREFLSGNIVVSLMVALAVLILAFYEPGLYPYFKFELFIRQSNKTIINPAGVIVTYAYFAFTLTWMREIVKDMEDFKGDIEQGCTTMPIKLGLKKTQNFVLALNFLTVLPVAYIAVRLLLSTAWTLGAYLVLAIVFPLLALTWFLPLRNTACHYRMASKILKAVMVAGVFTLFVYYL